MEASTEDVTCKFPRERGEFELSGEAGGDPRQKASSDPEDGTVVKE